MAKDQQEIRRKLRILDHAAASGDVSRTCRYFGIGRASFYRWRHALAVIQRKLGTLRNGAPFLELPVPFRQLQDQMLRRPGGDREPLGDACITLPANGWSISWHWSCTTMSRPC